MEKKCLMINNEHLAFEELLAFTAIEDLSDENKELSSRVYKHLRSCADCRRVLDGIADFTYALGREEEMIGFELSFASGEDDDKDGMFEDEDDFDCFTDRR